MAYDLEKYRDKREKVLGVKRRGISFQMVSGLFALLIVVSAGFIFVPDAVSYFNNRNLDDAIYKLEKVNSWSDSIIHPLKLERGVTKVEITNNGRRLVLTFNRTQYTLAQFEAFVKRKGFQPILLNRMVHTRQTHIKKEEKEFEAL